jgi:uncharacterized protein YbjT (DUF2867 family)
METLSIDSTILVVGSTGYLGTEICRQLAGKWKVKGLVRSTSNSDTVEALHKMGVETVTGDIKDPASLEKAMLGIDAVIDTVSSTASRQQGDSIETVDLNGQMNVVDAAKKAGVKHFVYISVIEIDQEFPLQTAKRRVEEHIKSSQITYTILRPAMFMDVWLSPHLGFDYVDSKATIYGEGVNPISWIALKDVASYAVASLRNAAALNKTIDLGGPDALSPLEVVKIFEKQSGTTFTIEHVPVETLMARRKEATDALQQSFSSLMIAYANGCVVKMDASIKDHFPTRLTTVSDYARHVITVRSAVL